MSLDSGGIHSRRKLLGRILPLSNGKKLKNIQSEILILLVFTRETLCAEKEGFSVAGDHGLLKVYLLLRTSFLYCC